MTHPTTRYSVNIEEKPRTAEHVDGAWASLVQHNADLIEHLPATGPSTYLNGNMLTRVAHTDDGHYFLTPYVQASLMEELSRVCSFLAPDRNGVLHDVPAPAYVAQMLLARAPDQLPGALTVNRIVDVPVFGSDEVLLTSDGYHPSARVFKRPGVEVAAPNLPTGTSEADDLVREQDVSVARDFLLDDLLGDFPFADEASKAHSVAMLIEPFVRELIGEHPTPLYLVYAHDPGVGKGLLADVVLGVGSGEVSRQAITPDETEMQKRVLATLLSGPSAVLFDNVASPPGIDSGVLAAALTSTLFEGRVLGHSKNAVAPVRCTWVATANNLTASAEITRRIVPIFLQPDEGYDPRTRTDWKHPQLREWARQHRGGLAAAALVLTQDWLTARDAAGDIYRPATAQFLASYESWSRVLGGILQHAGIPGFLGNMELLQEEVNLTREDAGNFLADLYDLSTEALTAAQWAQKIEGAAVVGGVTLPYQRRGDGVHAFGVWCRQNRGSVIDGYRLTKTTGRHTLWQVERVGE